MLNMVVHVAEDEKEGMRPREYYKGYPNRVWMPASNCEAIMEEFVADEVESILYIAREISGMPHALPHDVPVRE